MPDFEIALAGTEYEPDPRIRVPILRNVILDDILPISNAFPSWNLKIGKGVVVSTCSDQDLAFNQGAGTGVTGLPGPSLNIDPSRLTES
jgi:hypothetical protein